jgi:hypothetical protein
VVDQPNATSVSCGRRADRDARQRGPPAWPATLPESAGRAVRQLHRPVIPRPFDTADALQRSPATSLRGRQRRSAAQIEAAPPCAPRAAPYPSVQRRSGGCDEAPTTNRSYGQRPRTREDYRGAPTRPRRTRGHMPLLTGNVAPTEPTHSLNAAAERACSSGITPFG